MPAKSPSPLLLIVLLIALLFVPTTAAATIIDESMSYFIDASGNGTVSTASREAVSSGTVNKFTIHNIEDVVELYYLEFTMNGDWSGSNGFGPERIEEITYTIPGKETKTGRVHVSHSRNILGQVVASHALFFFDDWDVSGLTGKKYISTSFQFGTKTGSGSPVITGNPKINIGDQNEPSNWPSYSYVISCGQSWDSHLTVSEDAYGLYNIKLNRHGYSSTLTVYDGDNIKYTHYGTNDIDTYVTPPVTNITIIASDNTHTYTYPIDGNGEPGEPGEPGGPDGYDVTVYVRNSQTGNLLAGSHIIISASVGGEFYEVVNQTLPGGTATYTLQPTGGGLPNPDYYRLIATADGYNPYMPYIDFELDRPTNLIVMMEPITGGPVDENKTFIEFYVRDLSGNGISDASVTCGGYTLITNSAGYTQFEMPKNAIYPYTVRKSGYVTIEGTATVGDGPRYTVNVVLGPKEIPTNPPATDPGGPGATPTPDRRTNEEKGQAVIDMLADNAEGLGALALICLMFGLLKLMVKW